MRNEHIPAMRSIFRLITASPVPFFVAVPPFLGATNEQRPISAPFTSTATHSARAGQRLNANKNEMPPVGQEAPTKSALPRQWSFARAA